MTTKRSPRFFAWVLIVVFVFCVLLALSHGVHRARGVDGYDTGFFFRLAQNVLAPFITGILLGIVLFRLLASSEWPFLTTLSGFGIALLLALLLAKDPHLSILDNLKSASLPGLSFEFAGASKPSVEEGSFSPEFFDVVGPDSGSVDRSADRVDYALGYLEHWSEIIERDVSYMQELGFYTGDIGKTLEPEKQFGKRVIQPTARKISELRERLPRYGAELIDQRLATDIRQLAIGNRLPSARYLFSLQMLHRIGEIWDQLCARDKTSSSCFSDKKKVLLAGRRLARESTFAHYRWRSPTLLRPEYPYGAVLSSLVLYSSKEEDTAISDLQAWTYGNALEAAKSAKSPRWIGQYRALNLQTNLLATSANNPTYLRMTIRRLENQLATGLKLLVDGKWAPRFEYVLLQADKPRLLQEIGCNLPDTDKNFKRILWFYRYDSNNYAYYGALNWDAMHDDPTFATRVRDSADIAIRIPPKCLEGVLTSEGELAFQIAAYDTHAAVYLAIASNGRVDARMRKKAACRALESSEIARDLVLKARKAAPEEAPEAQFDAMLRQAKERVRDAIVKKRVRSTHRLADKLQAYEECPGYKLL